MSNNLVESFITLTRNSAYLTLLLGTIIFLVASLNKLPNGGPMIPLTSMGRMSLWGIASLLIFSALRKLFWLSFY